VVAVGASAGGVEALTRFAEGLDVRLPYAVLVVLHMPAGAPSVLAKIIDRAGPLPAETAVHGAPLQPGRIYVGIPGHHLLVDDHRVMLSEGPTENGYRPAVNALFRSAALAFGPRAIGIVMSGVLDDGVLGSAAIKSRCGTTIVQRPDDALYPAMPQNALEAGVIDHQVRAADAGRLLMRLAERNIEELVMDPDTNMELEDRIARGHRFSVATGSEELGPPSGYICPDCNGSLMELAERSFRCRVGHAWTADALLRARDEEVEGALWIALRSLQEKANMSRRLAKNVGEGALFERYSRVADEAEHAMTVLSNKLYESSQEAEERSAG
jgi:two-component system chemotaxis response regulator CheB